jgi:ribosomal protein L37AE/L43A
MKRNIISNDSEIREKKSCPTCSSLNVVKYRKNRGFHRCRVCHAIFPKPELKKVKTSACIPTTLKEFIEKKERQTAADSYEVIL